jgi:putative two-component system response regulator
MRKKILVVEDDKDLSNTLKSIMENAGHSVKVAEDGASALKLLKEEVFSLILLDIKLPDMDGLMIVEKAKRRFSDVVTIVITAYPSSDNVIKALRRSVYDFLPKPVDIEMLKKTVENALTEQEAILENRRLCEEVAKQNKRLTAMINDIKRLNREISKQYIETMRSLISALEAKDHYTKDHSENVARYAKVTAERMGLTENEVEDVFYAAQLHDLGKIGISDNILRKPGKLNDDEWREVKKHSLLSEEILKPLSFVKFLPIIRHHHERFDGTGYPDGLNGEDIPLGARIIAVADAYCAMIKDRPYRKAFSKEKAIEELKDCSGTQFDPKVVEVFLEIIEKEV